jgi:ubiquinone/menaquinone biosynthesis C-methylase UbiE
MTQWGKENVIDFYSKNRNKLSHLYDSEKIPLNSINKKKVNSILDYGCAVGGFYEIFKIFFNKNILYHGLDTEKKIIEAAQKKYLRQTKNKFSVIKKGKIKIKSNNFSLTFSTGVLNHNLDYKKIINELIRISKKYTFIDSPRVHLAKSFVGKLNLTKRFPSGIKKNNIVNNYTINFEDYLIFLKKTFEKNNINYAIFYSNYLPYKKKYLKINKKISFLTFLCSKNNYKSGFALKTKNKEMLKVFNKIFK